MGVRHIIAFLGFLFIVLSLFDKVLEVTVRRRSIVLLGALACYLLSVLLLARHVDFDLIYRVCSFFVLAVVFSLAGTSAGIGVSKERVFFIFALICLVCFALSLSQTAYVGEGNWRYNGLTLGMTNPNLTGMMLSGCIDIMIMLLPHSKRTKLSLLLISSMLYLLLRTNARSCIVTTVFLVIYVLLFAKRRVPTLIQLIAVLTPVLVVPIYLWASTRYSQQLFLGKPLFSGRESVFTAAISLLDTPAHLLFGDLTAQRFNNAHNSFLTILASLGVAGTFIVCLIFTNGVVCLGKSQVGIEQRLSLLSLLFVFVQSSAEASFLTGGFPTVLFIYLFVLVGNEAENHHGDDCDIESSTL